MVIVVTYDACLRLSEYFHFCVSVRQVSGIARGVNGYVWCCHCGVSARRLGLGIILVTYLIQLQVLFISSISSP